jgi:hypothetical protein
MSEEREEREEGPIVIGEMDTQSEEKEGATASIDVIDKQISIGEVPATVPIDQEEKPQEQNIEIEQVQEESGVSKRKQKRRRATSYLSEISKQVEKNGNQINKITMMIQSLLKQGQAKSTSGAGFVQSQFQSIKQTKFQISQFQKQVALIQKDIQKIRTAPGTKARTRKRPFAITIVPKSKKSKSITSTKARKSR